MDAKLYVGNLPYATSEDDLRELFSQAGTVSTVDVIKDRATGNSKGFAFVEMSNQQEAQKAIELFNGYSLANRELRVSIARPKEDSGRGNFGRRSDGDNRGQGRTGGNRQRRDGGSGQRRY